MTNSNTVGAKNNKIPQFLALIENGIADIRKGMHGGDIFKACKYILEPGGKRIRPLLVLLSGELFNGRSEVLLKPALAMEVFHNFTLIHDDIMDNADQRRGRPSVHKKWNRNIAVLAGDAMFAEAYDLLKEISPEHFRDILTLFNETARKVCYGQELDMRYESTPDVTEAEYLEVIELKTASLLACCLKTGAVLSGANKKDTEKLYEFGINLGISFQLRDDLLDAFGNQASFGKMIGGDIAADKQTFLMIKLRETEEEKLEELLNRKYPDNQDKIRTIQQLYTDTGVKSAAESLSNQYFESALACLEAVEAVPSEKQYLKNLSEELLYRVS